jgi:hypothetical protein
MRASTNFCFAFVAATLAGCAGKPCATTSQCGSGEVCASATCQALSCNSTYYAVDPSDGSCRPLPACGNRDDVRGWASCTDPCMGMREDDCIADPRCQPAYVTDSSGVTCTAGDEVFNAGQLNGAIPSNCSGSRTFAGCRANQLRVDPCAGLDQPSCDKDSRCVGAEPPIDEGCECPASPDGGVCNCPAVPAGGYSCRVKGCSDYTTAADCRRDSTCTVEGGSSTFPGFGTSGSSGGTTTTDNNAPPPLGADQPFYGCYDKGFGSCFGMDEGTCLRHSECHPVGGSCYCPSGASCSCDGGKFVLCEPDDGLKRCNSDNDCGGDQRCNNDEACAPPVNGTPQPIFNTGPVPDGLTTKSDPAAPSCPGLCVPKGCSGDQEKRCVGDSTCEPIYALECSPYGGGFGGEDSPPSSFCGGGLTNDSAGAGNSNGLVPAQCGGPCEPSFIACQNRQMGAVVDAEKSVLILDPAVIDAPELSFPTVMAALAGNQDPATFVGDWLNQIGENVTVEGRTAARRQNAALYMRFWPRLNDGRLDLGNLGFQVTSLSNRIDLAGPNDCGEARITYAFATGLTDRRHRMTIIVELGQPDDGAHCAATAAKWVALSKLSGDALRTAVLAIYAPLLAPEHVNQVRTNEFLVGPMTNTFPQTPWELREWHIGSDGALHLALSKQALDPNVVDQVEFTNWVASNVGAIRAQTVKVPEQFLAVTSSEDGSRISLVPDPTTGVSDFTTESALNQLACAGCHTTETNSAFAHVGERFNGTERAKISDFLRTQLPKRANLLFSISQRGIDGPSRAAPKSVH